MVQHGRVLVVVTSEGEYRDVGYRTGLWFSELSHLVDRVQAAGHSVDVASVMGGDVPIDPVSLHETALRLSGAAERYRDREFMDELRDTRSVRDVVSEDYDAIYFAGGHGAMFDFVKDERVAELASEMADAGKVVSSVCHGAAALLHATHGGSPLLLGRRATGYSWAEERLALRAAAVPFNLERSMVACGAVYSKARLPMGSHVVVDGRLVTGQNPASAKAVARAVLELI